MKYKIIIVSILLLSIFITVKNIQYSRADSGWDVSYDESSSYDYDTSSIDDNYSNSGGILGLCNNPSIPFIRYYCNELTLSNLFTGRLNFGEVLLVIIKYLLKLLFISFIIIVGIFSLFNKSQGIFSKIFKRKSPKKGTKINSVKEDTLAEFKINEEEFINMAFYKFVKIQEAWMNFDYDKLKELVTDELYNTYCAQLERFKIKKQKIVIKKKKKIDAKIIKIKKENNTLSVKVYLNVSMYDYIIDENHNLVRGSKKSKIDLEYKITFVKYLNNKVDVCPNCGGKLRSKSIKKCNYCGSIIEKRSNDYVMSSKVTIGQRRGK